MTIPHTPGPWRICKYLGRLDIRTDLPDHKLSICDIDTHDNYGPIGDPEEDAANARLIAAAPDMLDAIRHTVTGYDVTGGLTNLAITKLRAAIAKAEGSKS